jgi:hypothetical protein
MTKAIAKKELSDAELETLCKTICNDLETLRRQSETKMGRARILFNALGGFLKERGIVKDLALVANHMEQHGSDASEPAEELVH